MKCPKCGFNSFEFLDACKKCGSSFDSFKKLYRINPVMFHSRSGVCAASGGESPLSSLSPEAAEPVPSPVNTGQEKSPRDVPEERSPATRQEEPFAGFSFQLPESTPDEPGDLAFSGFSFQDEPAAPAASPVAAPPSAAFSFGDDNDGGSQEFRWTAPTENPGSESGNSDRMLEPESLGDTAAESGVSTTEGDGGYFGTGEFAFAPEEAAAEILPKEEEPAFSSDFSFAAEQVTEDIFQSAEEPVAVKSPEKKTPVDLDSFDKEFEMIFASDDGDETGKKN